MSVCLFAAKLLLDENRNRHAVFAKMSQNIRGRFISETRKIRTLFRTRLAEIRTVVGKIAQKWPFFRLFSNN